MTAHVTLPYHLETRLTEEGAPLVVRQQCARCSRVTRLVWNGKNVPEHIAKKFRLIGWQYSLHQPRKCICSRCCEDREYRVADPYSEVSKFKAPPVPLLPEIHDDVVAAYRCGMTAAEIAAEGGLYLPAVERTLAAAL